MQAARGRRQQRAGRAGGRGFSAAVEQGMLCAGEQRIQSEQAAHHEAPSASSSVLRTCTATTSKAAPPWRLSARPASAELRSGTRLKTPQKRHLSAETAGEARAQRMGQHGEGARRHARAAQREARGLAHLWCLAAHFSAQVEAPPPPPNPQNPAAEKWSSARRPPNRGLNYVRVVGEHRALVRRVQRLARGRKASGRVTMKSHTGTDVIIPTP